MDPELFATAAVVLPNYTLIEIAALVPQSHSGPSDDFVVHMDLFLIILDNGKCAPSTANPIRIFP